MSKRQVVSLRECWQRLPCTHPARAKAPAPQMRLHSSRFRAKTIKRGLEIRSNGWSFARFNVAARHQIHELAVTQNPNRRRRRRLPREVAAGTLGSFFLLPSEDRI